MANNLDALIDALADRVRNQLQVGNRVVRPNKFVTGQDFTLWLQQFTTYCEATNVAMPDRRATLMSLLDFGTAFKAAANLELDEELGFEEVAERLRDRFSQHRTVQDFKVELRARDQLGSESVEEFGDCLRELVRQSYPHLPAEQRDELARDRFLAGVRVSEAVRQALYLHDPPTLSDAMRRVRQSIAASKAAQAAGPARPAANVGQVRAAEERSEVELLRAEIDRLRKEVEHLRQPARGASAQDGVRGEGRVECARCFQPGHRARECSNPVVCVQCRRPGHVRARCSERPAFEGQGNWRGAGRGTTASEPRPWSQ